MVDVAVPESEQEENTLDESPRAVPEEGPARPREEAAGPAPRSSTRRDLRRAALYALVAISLAFGAATAALYGTSRRRQGRLIGKLESDLALAEETRAQLEAALAREKALREELAAASRRHGETVSTLLKGGEERRRRYTRAEQERREMSRVAEEKSDELIQRHNRIVELAEQVERLVRETSEARDAAHERERELRRIYEAEVRTERLRREELEEKLAVLDEINGLREELHALADRMQELVREEARRAGAERR